MRRSEWLVGLAFVGVLSAAPFLGSWARRDAGATCAYDGNAIEPLYRVRMVDAVGHDAEFCCIRCAELWLRTQASYPQAIYVVDETSGTEIDAAGAWFVRSLVVTHRPSGNCIHAFRAKRDAEAHVRSCFGHALEGAERPFPGRVR